MTDMIPGSRSDHSLRRLRHARFWIAVTTLAAVALPGCSKKSGETEKSKEAKPVKAALDKDEAGNVVSATFYKRVSAEAVGKLKEHAKLRDVTIMECKEIDQDSLLGLKSLPALTSVSLLNCQIGDDDMLHLNGLENLRNLVLENTNVTGTCFAKLTGLKNLKSLSLTGAKLNAEALESLGNFKQLTTLSLGHKDQSIASVKALGDLPKLKSLQFRRAQLNDDAFIALAAIPSLESLDLDGTNVADKGITAISKYPALRELKMYYAKITDSGVGKIAMIKTIEALDFTESPNITNGAIDHLTTLPNLRRLVLSRTKLRGKSLLKLTANKKLKRLEVLLNQMTAEQAAEFKKALPNCVVERIDPGGGGGQ